MSAFYPTPQPMVAHPIAGAYSLAMSCSYIQIGSYKVLSEDVRERGQKVTAIVSKHGILFELSHNKGDIFKKCIILVSHIQRVQAHLSRKLNVVFLTVGIMLAKWLRENLGMVEGENDFNPASGDEPTFNVILVFDSEKFKRFDEITLRKYLPMLEEIDESTANSKLIEVSPKSQLQTKTNTNKRPAKCEESNQICSTSFGEAKAPPRKLRKTKSRALAPSVQQDAAPGPILLTRYKVEIRAKDLLSLGNGAYLNDQIVEYWLFEVHSQLKEEIRKRTYVFTPFFYSRMITRQMKKAFAKIEKNPNLSPAQKRHCRVESWTKKFDLFSYDFIIVPIVQKFHWFLAVICYPGLDGPHSFDDLKKLDYKNINCPIQTQGKTARVVITVPLDQPEIVTTAESKMVMASTPLPRIKQPCILIFDSYRQETENHARVYTHLRTYLEIEFEKKKGTKRIFDKFTAPGFQPNVPQQPNEYDCGIYLLKYMEQFFETPLTSYSLPIPSMAEWFPISSLANKRKQIYDDIVERIKTEAPHFGPEYIPELSFEVEEGEVHQRQEECAEKYDELAHETTEGPCSAHSNMDDE